MKLYACCIDCGRKTNPTMFFKCPDCGDPLNFNFVTLSKNDLKGNRHRRYKNWIYTQFDGNTKNLGEGGTPLVPFKDNLFVNYPLLLRGASCFTEETLSTGATGRPSPARKKYTKKHMMFSAFIPSLPKGDFPPRKLKIEEQA